MKNLLDLLSALSAEDVDWIIAEGSEQNVIANSRIINEGELPESMFIVLQGLLGVHLSIMGDKQLRVLGPGEIVGEMSFLENEPANASVTAVESSLLLEIPKSKLIQKIDDDPRFSARLHRSLAAMLSRRLRESVGSLGNQLQLKDDIDRAVQENWKNLFSQVQELKKYLKGVDEAAIKGHGSVSDEMAQEVKTLFTALSDYLN